MLIAYICLQLISCGGTNHSDDDSEIVSSPSLEIQNYKSEANFASVTNFNFYENIPYGDYPRNKLDLLIPAASTPTGMVIYIHGGGFEAGDKSGAYDAQGQLIIQALLANNIAFAAINYRFIEENDQEGILKSLSDTARAVQFIKYFAELINIRKDRIVLLGGSAGAGASLWLGFNNDMADAMADNPVLRESTRVHALAVFGTQATYNIGQWSSSVFAKYQSAGLNSEQIVNVLTIDYLKRFFGVSTEAELFNGSIDAYQEQVDLLNLMTADDPEFYVNNSDINDALPLNFDQLVHHPLHAEALYNQAIISGVPVKVVTSSGLDNTNGEDFFAFVNRKMAE